MEVSTSHKKLGAQLLQRRRLKNLSQSEVAELADLTQSTVSAIEKGEGLNPTLKTLFKICDAIGCDIILVEKIRRE